MPRRVLSFSNLYPVHVTARTVNRENFPVPMNKTWGIMEDYLSLTSKVYDLKLHAFVLMPNHFHLLLQPTKDNLGSGLNYFLRETSKEISRNSGRINQVYGGRNYKTIITSERHFSIAYKYIYRNPVKAGLCNQVEDYPYSTLSFLTGKTRCILTLEEDTRLFIPDFSPQALSWLNRKPLDRHEQEVKLAFRRRIFGLPSNKNTKQPSDLETVSF
jgi:putative transposase